MTADERIEALLKRAGYPMMIVANPEHHVYETTSSTYNVNYWSSFEHALNYSINNAIRTEVDMHVRGWADTIEQLAAALENVLNERDALLEDLRLTAGTSEEGCAACAHLYDAADQMPCHACGGESFSWTWRGVPDKEDANE